MPVPQVATDLHGHTLFSDGRATPEAYVAFRAAQGMRVVAVSDHDVMSAVRRAALAAAPARMLVVPAMEVSSFVHLGTGEAEQLHVLAYFPPSVLEGDRLERTALYQRGLRVQARWKDFVLAWLDGLPAEDRAAVDPDRDLAALTPERFPALQSLIDRVVSRQRPLYEALRRHHVRFWDDHELFGWTPEEAIEHIRADGAVDVVAHAGRYRDRERTRRVLEMASGVEVYTSRHKPEVAAELRAFAEARGKMWTASSDDHQNARYMRPPEGTPVTTLERILGRPVPVDLFCASRELDGTATGSPPGERRA